MDSLEDWEDWDDVDDIDTALHFVLGENKQNVWLAEQIHANFGAVAIIDSRYKGGEFRNGIRYTNMELARTTFDLPDNLYFHSYMDPKNRKLKRR